MSLSDVQIGPQIGHLANNPELTYVGEGDNRRARASLVLISNRRRKNPETGELVERSTSIRWTLWGDQAENAMSYLKKGSHVAIAGRIENNNYDKEGETVYGFNFICEDIKYLDTKAESEARSSRSGNEGTSAQN